MTDHEHGPDDKAPIEFNFSAESQRDFAFLGLDEIAYIRLVATEDGRKEAGIFAANGEQIGAAPDLNIAAAATLQEGLQPVWVH